MKKLAIALGLVMALAFVFSGNAEKEDSPVLTDPYLGQKPPGLQPEVFAPGIISDPDYLEYSLTFSLDGKEIYFNRSGFGVFVCRLGDNGWSTPEKPEFAKVYQVGEVFITLDGKGMLMNRYRGLKEGEQGGIWKLHKEPDGWVNPKFLIPFGMRATSTLDGTIYTTDISGKDKDGADGGIIARYSLSGTEYQREKNPGGGVNSESLDGHPYIGPRESYIIFDSDRPGGMGKSDLYICFRNPDGSWGDAVNMKELNSIEADWCATVSPDGKYLFFTRNLDQNIYWVDAKIIEYLKPKQLD